MTTCEPIQFFDQSLALAETVIKCSYMAVLKSEITINLSHWICWPIRDILPRSNSRLSCRVLRVSKEE